VFRNKSGLDGLTLLDGLLSIGSGAFQGCTGLDGTVTIPDSVTSLGAGAFNNCSGLDSVVIGDGITTIQTQTFRVCTSLASVTLGKNVTSIGTYAFNGAPLANITMPASLATIGDASFGACANLVGVYFEGDAPTATGDPWLVSRIPTVYYLAARTGWGATFAGCTTVLWNPQIASDATFGAASGAFGFTITGGSSGMLVVVEACTDLGTWSALETVSFTGSTFAFSDAAYPGLDRRFYRFHMP